jgi:hypothetical protein
MLDTGKNYMAPSIRKCFSLVDKEELSNIYKEVIENEEIENKLRMSKKELVFDKVERIMYKNSYM